MDKTEEQWRREFYDEDYPLLYREPSNPQRTDAEVDAIAGLLRLAPAAKVLDLCCGQGRHAVRLQKRGWRVTGVDFSAPLLLLARSFARQAAGPLPPSWIRA